MTILLFANNAKSTLAAPLSSVSTTAVLASGTGSLFPSPTTGQGFKMTFVDNATGLLNEIVLVTARSGDTLTIVRAQEGTTAQSWLANDLAGMYFTAGSIQNNIQLDQYQNGTYDFAIATGSANALAATIPSNLSTVPTNFTFTLQAASTNTSGATLALTIGSTLLATKAIVKSNNQPLIAGDIASSGYPMWMAWSPVYDAYVLLNPATGESSALSPAQLQEQFYTYATATGASDTIAVTLLSTLTALSDGLFLMFKAGFANGTTTPNLTLTLGSTATATTTIVKGNNLPLLPGDIPGAGYVCEMIYSSVYGKWILLNPFFNPASLGSMAAQNSNAVNITGGNITGSYALNAASATYSSTTLQTNFSNLTIGGSQVLYAGNYNSYSPSLTGGGASGTWGINVSGNAAGLSSTLAVTSGGTGVTSLTANSVLVGSGTSAITGVAPSNVGNVLTSNGSTWTSQAPVPAQVIGSTWTDVTSSRSQGVTYTNTTGKFIQVQGNFGCNGGGQGQITIDGVGISFWQAQFNGCGGYSVNMPCIVPAGSTYSLNSMGGGARGWYELY